MISKHKNLRYYSSKVTQISSQTFYEVMFDDGSFSNDTYPEDIVVRMCLIWVRLDRSPPCDVVLQQKLHHTIFFHSWVNKIKYILSILESRLCQLGCSWSWGTCPSEMARWTVLWCQVPRIQYFLHVPGMTIKHVTYFFAVWPSYSIAVKSRAALHMFKSLRVVRSPELYAERLRVW